MSRHASRSRLRLHPSAILALTTLLPGQLQLPGGRGPLAGKHVVLLAGDEEYRSEEGLPMLARILAQRHGCRCTVLFSLAPDGTIDPEARGSLGMPEAIDSADLLVLQLRFRAWDDATMRRFVAKLDAGVPLVALRTSTHAFAYGKDSPSEFARFSWDSKEWPGGFGRQVLGETWVAHHGKHGAEATRGVVEPAHADHPILRGVVDVFGDTDVYTANPPTDCTVLLRGQVLAGMTPDSPPVEGKKNDPMQPIAWVREYANAAGTTNRVFVTTMGAATDLESAGLRRLLVNAVYHGLGVEVPEAADVDPVGAYDPTPFGFGTFRRGVRPEDHALPAEKTDEGGGREGHEDGGHEKDGAPALVLRRGERIALLGGGLAVQVASDGRFEALLHARFPDLQVSLRGFGWPGDEVGLQQRPPDYTRLDDPLLVFGPDTVLCFFGGNESFAGPDGVEAFAACYARWLDAHAARLAKDGRAPRFVLVSPIAPPPGPADAPGTARAPVVRAYAEAVETLARRRGLLFVDLFQPTLACFTAQPDARHAAWGTQLTRETLALVAASLDEGLFGAAGWPTEEGLLAALAAAAADKEWVHGNDYRMLNGWYVYGDRRTHDTETYPSEFAKIRAMVAARDAHLWALARGLSSDGPDDAATGTPFTPKTAFGTHRYAEPETLHFASAAESAAAMGVPEGFAVEPFASEAEFPELANPVQLNFDDRGRLWVACMPTYPHWRPGDRRPSDRLVILEDDDRDGRADRAKVFYEGLHCPTGFEFWNGGVLVTSQPRLLFLKDLDGDDRADVVETVFDGFATDDTHHAIGAFEWSPGGLLHMLEGLHMTTAVETPWGPVRNQGPPGCWVLDPRRMRLRWFQTPGYGNPWCYVFDAEGRGIVGDGTTGQQHYDALLSGGQFRGRGAPPAVFDNQGMRPVVGSEFLHSRHLPDDVQGQMVYACVINMHGLTRFEVGDDGAGLAGRRIDDLLASDDGMFRPVDPQIGPDGALWFGDWCNPLIGHMQYSQRDPNRDKAHGRVFRLIAKDRPLLAPVTQHGRSVAEVVGQLREPEPRTRYRARRWLRAQPPGEVAAALRAFLAGIASDDPQRDRLRTEALWVQQGIGVVDAALLQECLAAESPVARAAAVHVVADLLHDAPGEPLALLARAARDPDPRVRLQALRGLSLLPERAAVLAALAVAEQPLDRWLDYALDACLSALAPVWQPLLARGEPLAPEGSNAAARLANHAATKRAQAATADALRTANDRGAPVEKRRAAMAELVRMPGNPDRGRAVFRRMCIACHRIEGHGVPVGPDLAAVGARLEGADLAEALFEPNARIDPRYALVHLQLRHGDPLAGFVEDEAADVLTLRLPDGTARKVPTAEVSRREVLATSTMPEGLMQTVSPAEAVDLLEYLEGLK